jgi:predicted lipoprotein
MTTPSKAERIRALLDEGKLSHAEIAAKIDVLPEYVRAVKQRQDQNSWYNKARRNGDVVKAREEGRLAYLEATKAGETPLRAANRYGSAHTKTMLQTGRETATL